MLPEVQQLVTAVMGTLDDQALHTLLDHRTVVRQAITAAPTDLPPPFLNPEHQPDSPRSVPPGNPWVVVAQVLPGHHPP